MIAAAMCGLAMAADKPAESASVANAGVKVVTAAGDVAYFDTINTALVEWAVEQTGGATITLLKDLTSSAVTNFPNTWDASNPIVIDGPVVIDSDVVIKGYVKGQGTIYSGRNIHIAGSIQYVNAPSWPHPDNNPDVTTANNMSKDLLGLAAKGNIVMGDYTLSSWLGSSSGGLQYYLKSGPYVQQYICDASDNTIGYPRTTEYGWTSNESTFCGDYTQRDGGKKVAVSTKTEYVYENGRRVQKTTTTIADKQERKYYESVCPEKLIQQLCNDTQSSRGTYQPTITRIDAVMYNNHGIIGHIGNCTINGSLVCRNEAMIYEGALKINWDHRLYSGLSGSMSDALGLPMDASRPPQTLSWREISN